MTKPGHERRPHIFYVATLSLLTLFMTLPGIANLPVIDRDEARYAQAAVQMVESGDYLNIRFQNEARNRKPAGIYWMQAAGVKAFTDPGEREIWAHRIPSVLGALIAVLATYWGGGAMLGRRGAFLGASVLAVSALFVFEAHIAKTDAMLCAMCTIILAALMRLRRADSGQIAFGLWLALGIGIMIKGPVAPALLIITLITLAVWERGTSWMKRILSGPGIIVALLLTVPWAILIHLETDGAFFRDAIGGDFAPKLVSGQEKHGALPGYYLLTLPILFFPGTLILFPSLVFAWKSMRHDGSGISPLAQHVRILLAWLLPFWAILEFVPTKLPNYLLPAYPALSLLCGGALSAILSTKCFTASKRIGAVLYFLIAIVLLTVVLAVEALYADPNPLSAVAGLSVLALIFTTLVTAWTHRAGPAIIATGLSTLILSTLTYQSVLPRSSALQVSRLVENALGEADIKLPRENGPNVGSPHFTEPSLVYRLGTNIFLGENVKTHMFENPQEEDIILIDSRAGTPDLWQQLADTQYGYSNLCLEAKGNVKGMNYSRGDEVSIAILRAQTCEMPIDPLSWPELPTNRPDP
ncbi:MAG: glycosyltransferase family 39 protein [Hyphomonadaceae bacterium]|nr:glycosyltransferase family 39 protein [Hyphomonadaceae bacterium]